jgi:hypothetical protein
MVAAHAVNGQPDRAARGDVCRFLVGEIHFNPFRPVIGTNQTKKPGDALGAGAGPSRAAGFAGQRSRQGSVTIMAASGFQASALVLKILRPR